MTLRRHLVAGALGATVATPAPRKKVLISGCYDLLHSGTRPLSISCSVAKHLSYYSLQHICQGHVQFFKEASELGDLHVSVGSDKNIMQLKGRPTMIPESERLFMVQSIKYVHYAEISPVWFPRLLSRVTLRANILRHRNLG